MVSTAPTAGHSVVSPKPQTLVLSSYSMLGVPHLFEISPWSPFSAGLILSPVLRYLVTVGIHSFVSSITVGCYFCAHGCRLIAKGDLRGQKPHKLMGMG